MNILRTSVVPLVFSLLLILTGCATKGETYKFYSGENRTADKVATIIPFHEMSAIPMSRTDISIIEIDGKMTENYSWSIPTYEILPGEHKLKLGFRLIRMGENTVRGVVPEYMVFTAKSGHSYITKGNFPKTISEGQSVISFWIEDINTKEVVAGTKKTNMNAFGESYKQGHQHQFLIDLPAGWSAYDQMKAITGKASPTGMVIFSKENISKMEIQDQRETMASIDIGEMPSFFVDRLPKKKKMSCSRFGKKETKLVLKLIERDNMFGRDRKIIAPPEANHTSFGGCEGIRIKGETEKQDGTRWVIDMHAVSDGKILYLFTLRNIKKNYEKNLSIYEKAMSTVQLTSIE